MLRCIITILACAVFTSLYPQLKHITTDDGLPSNRVYGITVDSKGFLWCSTDRGIAMYDGNEFTCFTTENGLPLNDIYRIIPTPDGKIWYFGKSSQLGYIQNGAVKKYPCVDGSVMNPSNFIIMGNYVGFYHDGCSYYLYHGKWVKICAERNFHTSLLNRKKTPTVIDNTYLNTVITFDENEFVHYSNNGTVLKKFNIYEPDWSHRNWYQANFYGKDMFYFMNFNHIYAYNHLKKDLSVLDLTGIVNIDNYVYTTFFWEGNKIGITNNSGKYFIDNKKLIPDVLSENLFFDKTVVMGTYHDFIGNVWGNTRNDGIYKIPVSAISKTLLKGKSVQKIEIFQNRLFAAVEEEGIYRVDFGGNNSTEILPVNPAIDSRSYYYQLKNRSDTALEVLTAFRYYNYTSNKVIDLKFNYTDDLKSGGAKTTLFIKDTLFFVTGNDLWVVDFPKNKVMKRISFVGGYAIQEYDDHIFIGSNSGLYIYNHGQIQTSGILNGIPIKNLTVWKNRLIVGTDGMGIYYLEGQRALKANYLSRLVVNEFYIDHKDRLWISSNFGAHRVTSVGSDIFIQSVLSSHGLISNHVNAVRSNSTWSYFATDRGLCALKVDEIKFEMRPNISIKKIMLNDSLYDPDSKDIRILSSGDNRLSVDFDVAFLGEHKQLKTYYRIEPIHQDWVELNASEINYRGLDPGKYKIVFKVIGLNNNTDTTEIECMVIPRWFELNWVRNLMGVSLMMLFVVIVVIISRQVNKNVRRKYALKKKMVEIELDALRSKLNPHFIFNTLNSIQFYIHQNDLASSEKYLVLFSNHIRDVFEYSLMDKLTLDKEIRLITDYLMLEEMRFEGKISYRIEVDPVLRKKNLFVPSMLLQPYVENAIKHGLLPKKHGAELIIRFSYLDAERYEISIMDNGHGFDQKDMSRKSSTVLIDERIHLLNESGKWIINKIISNLYEDRLEKGAVVKLIIQYIS